MEILLLLAVQQIEFKSAVEKKEGGYTFRVEGFTKLPKGTVLRLRVYALDEVMDPQNGGTMMDEEPLFYGDEAYQDAQVEGGKFSADVYALKRKPYSLRYRIRAIYDPEYQNDEILKAAGRVEFHQDSDLRYGDDGKLGEELKATSKELHDEFILVKELHDELKREFAAAQKKYDSKAWKKWLDPWMDKVQGLKDRNEDRLMLWTVWLERQGKLRIEGFSMRLPDLATDCREHLEGANDALERTQLKMKAFLDYYEEAIEIVGLEMPLDLETIGPALTTYEKQVRELLSNPSRRAEIKRGASEALLAMAGAFENRRKGYYRISEITSRFTGLLKIADAVASGSRPKADLEKALEEHDREVRAFKVYAGIK